MQESGEWRHDGHLIRASNFVEPTVTKMVLLEESISTMAWNFQVGRVARGVAKSMAKSLARCGSHLAQRRERVMPPTEFLKHKST